MVTIVGAILAGVCIIASSFAQNVLTLIFTIGIGTGFGLGMLLLLSGANRIILCDSVNFFRINLSTGYRKRYHIL